MRVRRIHLIWKKCHKYDKLSNGWLSVRFEPFWNYIFFFFMKKKIVRIKLEINNIIKRLQIQKAYFWFIIQILLFEISPWVNTNCCFYPGKNPIIRSPFSANTIGIQLRTKQIKYPLKLSKSFLALMMEVPNSSWQGIKI